MLQASSGPSTMLKRKRNTKFSDAILSRWVIGSLLGLIISVGSWVGGEFVLTRLQRTGGRLIISIRVVVAAVSGFGMGFTVLFMMTSAAGVLYWAFRRRVM
jgi:hypothetical protein